MGKKYELKVGTGTYDMHNHQIFADSEIILHKDGKTFPVKADCFNSLGIDVTYSVKYRGKWVGLSDVIDWGEHGEYDTSKLEVIKEHTFFDK